MTVNCLCVCESVLTDSEAQEGASDCFLWTLLDPSWWRQGERMSAFSFSVVSPKSPSEENSPQQESFWILGGQIKKKTNGQWPLFLIWEVDNCVLNYLIHAQVHCRCWPVRITILPCVALPPRYNLIFLAPPFLCSNSPFPGSPPKLAFSASSSPCSSSALQSFPC